MKIQNKIIYILVSIFLLYTLIFSVFIYYSISNYAFADFHKRLEIRAATTAKIQLEHPTDVTSIKEIRQDYLEKLPNEQEYIFQLFDDTINAAEVPEEIPMSFIEKLKEDGAGSYNNKDIFYSGIRYITSDKEDYIVIISADNYFNNHHIAYLRNLLWTSVAYAIVLIVLISVLISRTVTQPLNNIIKSVKEISSENLHLRLKMPKNNDALSRLTLTFNDMLNRLETSFETQKNFISNASHELNTPLTSIIGEADLALSKDRATEEYKEALSKILMEAEKLDKKTRALLFLAQTGFDGKSQKFDKVRMDQLILDVKETVETINTDSKISIDFSLLPENPEKLKVKGNDQLLHLAFSNLIVNACKYSDNACVNVALGATNGQLVIIVKDRGIGIPEQELQYIYDPYFRASNTTNYEGYGIGLPLARNIIRMHEGELIVHSVVNQGTTVQVNIPLGNYKL